MFYVLLNYSQQKRNADNISLSQKSTETKENFVYVSWESYGKSIQIQTDKIIKETYDDEMSIASYKGLIVRLYTVPIVYGSSPFRQLAFYSCATVGHELLQLCSSRQVNVPRPFNFPRFAQKCLWELFKIIYLILFYQPCYFIVNVIIINYVQWF